MTLLRKIPAVRHEEQAKTDRPDVTRNLVEVYTRDMLVTGRLELLGRRRLSDILNEPERFIALEAAEIHLFTGTGYRPPIQVDLITVNKRSIMFATPHEEAQGTRTTIPSEDLARVQKRARPVFLHMPPYLVEGHVHLVKGVELVNALNRLTDSFVAVTDAAIFVVPAPSKPATNRSFVCVNLDHIAAMHATSP